MVRLKVKCGKSGASSEASFNSIVVRLKGGMTAQRKIDRWSFNSIVVRLKARFSLPHSEARHRFQFHSGSIKSIESCDYIWARYASFNSIVVRLKGYCGTHYNRMRACFNSIVVRLKDRKPAIVRSPILSFNSIVVRLKVNCRPWSSVWNSCFNSIVVRLKGRLLTIRWSGMRWFQFHSGSIKSPSTRTNPAASGEFQFHSGSIKRRSSPPRASSTRMVSIP